MPKSTKLYSALITIEEITKNFESDGLGLLVPRPLTLAESLGHLRDSTMTGMYRLAAEKYTQSVRRLASSQAQQSAGKTVKIADCEAMTMNKLYEYLISMPYNGEDLAMTISAMEPESEVIHACTSIVRTARIGNDTDVLRGNVINRMPEFETIYDTISPMVDVLLYIIDTSNEKKKLVELANEKKKKKLEEEEDAKKRGEVGGGSKGPPAGTCMPADTTKPTQGDENTNKEDDRAQKKVRKAYTLYEKYGTYKTGIGTIKADAKNILTRFDKYFKFYTVEKACAVIMQGKINAVKERSWVQPKIDAETMGGFLKGLYGVTLKKGVRYKIIADVPVSAIHNKSADIVRTIYTTTVLNRIYDQYFPILAIDDVPVSQALYEVESSRLSKNDMLKLAVLRQELSGDRDLLSKLYEADKFSYSWIKTQEYKDGKYRGDWEIAFKMGKMSGRFIRDGERIKIVVNTMNMHLLLKAMRLTADRCFSRTYEYDEAWWLCPIWRQTAPPYKNYKYYLKHYSHFESIITSNHDDEALGIILKNDELFYEKIVDVTPARFIVDDILRVIYVEFTSNVGPDRRYRMASIYQDLTIPMRDKVTMTPMIIQGFSNIEIYSEGIIEDLVLSRPISTTMRRTEDLVQGVFGVNKLEPVWNMFYNMYNKLKRHPVIIREAPKETKIQIYDWDTSLTKPLETVQYHETTEVEKLENIQIEHDSKPVPGQHKVKHVPDILGALCRHLWSGITERNKLDYINSIIIHDGLREVMNDWKREDFDDTQRIINALANSVKVPDRLFSFAIGSQFETYDFWEKVNRANLSDIRRNPAHFYGEEGLVNDMVVLIRDLFNMDAYAGVDTLDNME